MSHFCSFRNLGDAAIVLSFPVLIGRILKRGNAGISATAQGLYLIVFLLRYADITTQALGDAWRTGLSWSLPARLAWIPWIKVYITAAAIAVLVAMRSRRAKSTYQKCSFESIRKSLREYAFYLIPAFLIAYRFNYTSFSWLHPYGSVDVGQTNHTFTWVVYVAKYFSLGDLFSIDERDAKELAWAMSIFLAAFADIPQYVAYYKSIKGGMDWWLLSAMGLLASTRMFYLFHWVQRFIELHIFDPISFVGAVIQVFAFWMLVVLSISKATDCIGENDVDLEAQMAAYDAERWGEVLPDDQHEK